MIAYLFIDITAERFALVPSICSIFLYAPAVDKHSWATLYSLQRIFVPRLFVSLCPSSFRSVPSLFYHLSLYLVLSITEYLSSTWTCRKVISVKSAIVLLIASYQTSPFVLRTCSVSLRPRPSACPALCFCLCFQATLALKIRSRLLFAVVAVLTQKFNAKN